MKTILSSLVLFSVCVAFSTFVWSQEVASITGVITDNTGAVISDASVKLLDSKTNATYQTRTNAVGGYTFVKVLPGPGYKLIVSKDGFETVTVSDIYIAVGSTHTTNAQLEPGKVTETVEVSGAEQSVTLDTTDTVIGNNIDMREVQSLPIEARESPLALMDFQPGVVDTNSRNDDNGSREGAVTGARTDQDNVTLDGLDVNDFATGQAFSVVGDAPVDSVQEFRAETANPLAATGRGSGAQVQLVTKSGTNQWHGSAFDYLRNTVTEANTYFNNRNKIARPKLIRNSFGADLGGPVLKDKLFFFFDYQGRRDAREDTVLQIVPLDSYRAGSVSYINRNAGCTAQSRVNTQPGCITTLTNAQILAQGLDPANTGTDAALLSFINSRYPHANDLTVGDGVNTGGFRFNSPVGRSINDYVTRIDYDLGSKMKLFGRFSLLRDVGGDDVNFQAPIQFPGDPLTNTINDTSYAYVIGHTWTITSSKVNQFYYGETRSQLNFPVLSFPSSPNYFQFFGPIANPYPNPDAQNRIIPIPVVRDDFTYVHGTHNIQVGGTYKWITSLNKQTFDYNLTSVGLGQNLSSLRRSQRPSDLLGNPVARNIWDSDFTFALGRFAGVNTNVNYNHSLQPLPLGTGHARNYKYQETEVYLQDTWKARSDLTLTYGLRWQYYSVPYEIHGLEAIPSQGFSQFLNPRLLAGPQGSTGPFPFITYDLAGKANHAPGLYHPDWRDFAPRLSFAFNPSAQDGLMGRILGDRKSVIRAGFGIVFDHPVTNAVNFLQDQSSYLFQNTVQNPTPGNLATDPRFTSLSSVPAGTPPAVTRPATPFVDSSGTAFGSAVGSTNYAADPNLKTPYSITFTMGFQRELPGHLQFETNYFGRLGRRLISQADAGQVVNFKDPASGHTLSADFADLSKQLRVPDADPSAVTPEPFFENQSFPGATQAIAQALQTQVVRGDLGDVLQALDSFGVLPAGVGLNPQFATNAYITNQSFSTYHGLLSSLQRNFSNGLQFNVNYTYSHSIDNASAPTNNIFGTSNFAGGLICDVLNLGACRGNSDFDITHIENAIAIWDLPIGRSHRFGGGMSPLLNKIVGGWQLSGVQSWHSGFAFTTVSNAFPISFANNAPAIFNGDNSAIATHIHTDPTTGTVQLFANQKRASDAFRGPLGLESGNRNNLRGPSFLNFDLGLAKHIPISERVQLTFRADAFNAFNHTNFNLPGNPGNRGTADITDPGQFGVITATGNPRQMQFALRLDF